MEIKEVTYWPPYSPLSIFPLLQDVAQRDLNDSFVSRLSLGPPELVPNQESGKITKPRQLRQGSLCSLCYLLSAVKTENLNASPNIFFIFIFSYSPLSIGGCKRAPWNMARLLYVSETLCASYVSPPSSK
jgi:hypothetical protein